MNKYWICGKQSVIEVLKSKKRSIFKVLLNKKNSNSKLNFFDEFKKITYFKDNKEISKVIKDQYIRHQGYAVEVSSKIKKFTIEKITNYKTVVALDKVTDTRNIGGIIRTCAAFGVDLLIINKRYFKESSMTMNKAACGATEHLEVLETANIKYEIDRFKKINFHIFSLSLNANKKMHANIFHEKNLLIFGSEDEGISKNILNKSDDIIKINTIMDKSLNVSCSVSSVLAIINQLKISGK